MPGPPVPPLFGELAESPWRDTGAQRGKGRGTMRVGILGSGLMGAKLGTILARAGHEVVFSYARSAQKLKRLAREAKGKAEAGTPREAAQDADACCSRCTGRASTMC
jgi:3-hydroxyacyl-CoA dehydrogenase